MRPNIVPNRMWFSTLWHPHPLVHKIMPFWQYLYVTHLPIFGLSIKLLQGSGITRNMVIPGLVTEVVGESRSRGLGVQPPAAEKDLILHVLRIAWNCSISKSTLVNDVIQIFYFTLDMKARCMALRAFSGSCWANTYTWRIRYILLKSNHQHTATSKPGRNL